MATGRDDFSWQRGDQRAVNLLKNTEFDLPPLNELLDEDFLIVAKAFRECFMEFVLRSSLADTHRRPLPGGLDENRRP
ncbi:hypothetical protein D3C87_1814570 [compost metagenome]